MSTATNPDPPATAPSFLPLEANPELLTELLHKLGLSPALAIHDVYSLDDPSLLAFVPRPALALLLVFPITAAYESYRLAEDALNEEYSGKGEDEPVLWFKQTIRNACGTIGLLHATCNGSARSFIEESSTLSNLIKSSTPLPPFDRARLLENTPALAAAHQDAASQGATEAPSAEADVDLHYVCFVKTDDGRLWELDGRRKGPLLRGQLAEGEDVLSESALTLGPKTFLSRENGDLRFSCVALAGSLD